jgi:hypothetical protein
MSVCSYVGVCVRERRGRGGGGAAGCRGTAGIVQVRTSVRMRVLCVSVCLCPHL